MKRVVFSLILFGSYLGSLVAQGQGVLSIVTQPVCWSYNNVDSNITAYYLFSSQSSTPLLKNYLDAVGSTVNTAAGGSFQNGFCCCSSSSAVGNQTIASQTDSLLGLTTFTVGNIDTVGLDIASLTQSAPKADGYLVFYDQVTNRNYKILISSLVTPPYPGYASCECDTVYQVGHHFVRGDILGQERGFGLYFEASTGDPDSLPVAYVHEVLHVDTFVIKSEGWLMDWTHGLPLGRDYFVQDTPGVLDTIPDSTYSVFAYRTIDTTKAYFDIPELVVDQAPGSSGGGASGDADWYAEGTTAPPTSIAESIYTYGDVGIGTNSPNAGLDIDDTTSVALRWKSDGQTLIEFNKAISGTAALPQTVPRIWIRSNYPGNDLLVQIHPLATTYFDSVQIFRIGPGNIGPSPPGTSNLHVNGGTFLNGLLYDSGGTGSLGDLTTYYGADASGNTDWRPSAFYEDASGNIVANTANIPDYANDAAADADGALPSGAIYQVTAEDRTIRIKP